MSASDPTAIDANFVRPGGTAEGQSVGGAARRRWDSVRIAVVLAWLIVCIAAAVMAGWLLRVLTLTSWLSGQVTTKFNAGLCLLLLGTAVILLASRGARARPVAFALALAVLAVAGATVLEHLSGIDFGIDQAVVRDTSSAPYPGRFAVQTGVAFMFAAAAILLIGRRFRGVGFTELLALVVGLVGVTSLLGHMYGASPLLDLGSAAQISLPASIVLTLLSLSLIGIDGDHAIVRLMWDRGMPGQVMRRFVPAALIVVPAGAWLRLVGEQARLFDEATGLAILVGFESLVLAIVGAWTVSRTQHLEGERSRATAALARLGAAASTPLIETAPIGLAVLDRDLRFMYANPAMARANGRDATAHLGQRVDRVIRGLDPETVRALDVAAEMGEAVRDVEFGPDAPSDSIAERWLLNAEPLRDSSGELAGLTLSVVEVSERRNREDAVAAVAEMRLQARAIGESIPYGIWIAEPDGHMQYLSESFLALIGQTMEEAAGFGWVKAIAPEFAESTMRDWRRAVTARRPWNYELVIPDSRGRRHTILSRGVPIRDDHGRVTSWAGINLDLSDRKEAETFREAFIGILSHELRTPITAIYAAGKLLERPGLDGSHREGLVEDISHEAERLRRLVDDLLVLARTDSGATQVRTEPVLLQHILPRVCAQEQSRWPDRHFELSLVNPLPVARAEEAFVEQIVRNLLGNAAKYGARGEPIQIVADAPDGWPRVRVLDRGPGVDPDEAPRLFELFYRSDRTARVSGSGIGLFVAHRLIESMGGSIWARPRDDGPGAEFGFRLQPVPDEA